MAQSAAGSRSALAYPRTYAYDAFGRLASTTLGATTTSYTLDRAGRRTAETTGASTTSFDLDLRGELATILGDGSRRYLPGDPSAGYEQSGTWYSALADQLGSPHSYVSSTGVQSAIARWDPFGAPRPGSSTSTGIGYAGEWRDPTGLIDLRARAYDPSLGRFTSRDTFGGLGQAPQTANRYSYALNGPYRYADPSGHFVLAAYTNGPMLLSIGIQMIPVVGDAYSAFTGIIGFDPIAGVSFSDAERAIAIGSAFVIGGGLHLLGRMGDGVADASRLGRAGEAAGGAGVGARGLDGARDGASIGRSADRASVNASGVSAGSIRYANPTGSKTNCVMCVVATEARLRGAPASALAGKPRSIRHLETYFGSTFQHVTGRTEIEATLREAGNGAQGVVFGIPTGQDLGHVFNAVNQNGAIRFLDGQIGGEGSFLGLRDLRFMLIPSGSDVRVMRRNPAW
jgi:RHS repeat-associated protein